MSYWDKTPRERLETPWYENPYTYIGFAVGILIGLVVTVL